MINRGDMPSAQLGRNLTRGLLDRVGREIVIGGFEERIFPTEEFLAHQYGVSRTVTREAMKMLAAKGLLDARPRQGTYVQPISNWNLLDPDVLRWMLQRRRSLDALREFTQLRFAIEPEAAALAAETFTMAEAGAMKLLLEKMAVEQDAERAVEADIAFHVSILVAAKNPFFANFREPLRTALRHSIRFTNQVKGRSSGFSKHSDVLDALMQHKSCGAKKLVRSMIQGVLINIESELKTA